MGLVFFIVMNLELVPSHRLQLVKNKYDSYGQVCFNDHCTVKIALSAESNLFIVVSTCTIVGPTKDDERVAFGPQPHDWLACQRSAIHTLPGKIHSWNFSFRALCYF